MENGANRKSAAHGHAFPAAAGASEVFREDFRRACLANEAALGRRLLAAEGFCVKSRKEAHAMSTLSARHPEKKFRIGVDLGGTKIEFIALENDGRELLRHRVPTPRGDYDGTVRAIREGVLQMESQLQAHATVGVGIPGTISRLTGTVKNANSTWMIGRPFDKDLSAALDREVRCANDANCLAVSEATDGTGAGQRVVFAVILGTGVGGGIAFEGRVHNGYNGVAGEWGHTTLPWMKPDEYPGPACYCGYKGCLETWISGTGLGADYERATQTKLHGKEIAARSEAGEAAALACLERYEDRVTRSLAQLINILDPDIIVLGGGVSQVPRLYRNVPP